jgi:hypothetical protein
MLLSNEEKLKLMSSFNWDYLDTHEDMLPMFQKFESENSSKKIMNNLGKKT